MQLCTVYFVVVISIFTYIFFFYHSFSGTWPHQLADGFTVPLSFNLIHEMHPFLLCSYNEKDSHIFVWAWLHTKVIFWRETEDFIMRYLHHVRDLTAATLNYIRYRIISIQIKSSLMARWWRLHLPPSHHATALSPAVFDEQNYRRPSKTHQKSITVGGIVSKSHNFQ